MDIFPMILTNLLKISMLKTKAQMPPWFTYSSWELKPLKGCIIYFSSFHEEIGEDPSQSLGKNNRKCLH